MALDKLWLVKSSAKILGPYTTDELVFLLKARKISIIDEIRKPKLRWKFIREYKEFEKLVSNIRETESSMTESTDTETFKDTDPAFVFNDSMTPHPLFESHKIENARDRNLNPIEVKKFRKTILKTKSKSNFWIFFFMLVIIVSGAGYYMMYPRSITGKKQNLEELLSIARKSSELGAYNESLSYYKKANQIGPLDNASIFQSALLSLIVENSILEARRVFDNLHSKLLASDPLRKEVKMALALSYFLESNLSKAEELYQGILFSEENNIEALVNLGLLGIHKSDFSAAHKIFSKLQKDGYKSSIVSLGNAISVLGLIDSKQNNLVLKDSIEDLEDLVKSSYEYRIENLLILAVLHIKNGNLKLAEDRIAMIFNESPNLTKDHLHNLLVHQQTISWERLSTYCDFIGTKLHNTAASLALGALCSYQKNDVSLALQKVEEAGSIFPNDLTIMGVHSFLLFNSNRSTEAQQIAKLSFQNSILSGRVLAKACEQKQDFSCAKQIWTDIIKIKENDIEALTGQLKANLPELPRDSVQTLLNQALLISPNYIPLLKIKEKI